MTANFQIVPDNNISIIVDILHPSVDAYSKKKNNIMQAIFTSVYYILKLVNY